MIPRRLAVAIVLSLVVHLLAIFGGEVDVTPRPDLMRLEARLSRASASDTPTETPRPARKPKKKKKPETPPPQDLPQAQLPEPATEEAPPPPEPEPPAEVAEETVADEPPSPEPAAPTGTGNRWPKAGQITFAVLMGEQRFQMGRSTHQWQIDDDNQYRLSALTEPTGVAMIPWFKPDKVLWTSSGRLTEKGLQPHNFVDRRENKGTTGQAELDWEKKEIRFASFNHPLPDGTQDLLSLFYQLGYPESIGNFEMPVTTGRKVEIYRFEYVGEESLALPFGMTWRTYHMRARYGTNEMTEVWVAPEHFGLPVQVRTVDRKGVVYYLLATEVLVAKDALDEKKP